MINNIAKSLDKSFNSFIKYKKQFILMFEKYQHTLIKKNNVLKKVKMRIIILNFIYIKNETFI